MSINVGILTDGAFPGGEITDSVSSGTIELEVGWQLISIPIQYGYWDASAHAHVHDDTTTAKIKNYVVDQIEDIQGVDCNTLIEIFNTYPGDVGGFLSFVPGVTNPLSSNNFALTYVDGTYNEVMGFWVKNISASSFTITWG